MKQLIFALFILIIASCSKDETCFKCSTPQVDRADLVKTFCVDGFVDEVPELPEDFDSKFNWECVKD